MIKLRLLFLFIILAVSCGTDALLAVQPQPDLERLYYIGEWQWTVTADEQYWAIPYVGSTGSIDLRNLPQMGTAGTLAGVRQCCAFVVSDTLLAPDLTLTLLGRKTDLAPVLEMERRLRLPLEAIESATVETVIHELLTLHGDPTGLTRWKPPLPDTNREIRIRLGSGEDFSRETVRPGTELFDKVSAVLQHDYERIRSESLARGDSVHLKVADYWREQYGVDVRSMDRVVDGFLPHETTITEDWNCADSDSLNCDLTWVELTGDLDIISNSVLNSTAVPNNSARAESNLSSADHYSQADCTAILGTLVFTGTAVRFDESSHTYYAYEWRNASPVTNRLIKVVTGTVSNLGNNAETAPGTGPFLTKTEINGSTLKGYRSSLEKISLTDTSITGELRTGIHGNNNGVNRQSWDNFEAADLAVTPETQIMIITKVR